MNPACRNKPADIGLAFIATSVVSLVEIDFALILMQDEIGIMRIFSLANQKLHLDFLLFLQYLHCSHPARSGEASRTPACFANGFDSVRTSRCMLGKEVDR